MHFHVVINPAGASGRTGKIWQQLEPVFAESGQEYTVHYSTKEKGIDDLCRELATAHAEEELNLTVVGGDGTFNQAVNGAAQGAASLAHIRFGLIPGGSANDMVRDMNQPKDDREIAAHILEGITRQTTDIGEVLYTPEGETTECSRLFNVSSGFGFDAAICYAVDTAPGKAFLNKIGLGKLIYLVQAIRLIFTTKKVPLTLALNSISKTYDHSLFAVGMNHAYEGGGFKFCPHASCTDGQLDLCIANPVHNAAFFRLFPFAYSGAHLKFDCVDEHRAPQIRITAPEPQWLHTDGEAICRTSDITLRIYKDKLQMLN